MLEDFLQNIDWDFWGPIVVALITIGVLSTSLKIVNEYQRMAFFVYGRFVEFKGPGLIFVFPRSGWQYIQVGIGARGTLISYEVARFNTVDLPVATGETNLRLGDTVQVTAFEQRNAIVNRAPENSGHQCPKCGHEFH